MLFLVLAFSCAAALLLLFKVFERRGIPIFQSIVFNYLTATACAFIFLPDKQQIISGSFLTPPWLPFAIGLGIMFITVFNLTSLTTIHFDVSTASVASKLGLIFPVMLAFLLYHESLNWLKIGGILFALVAVILSSIKEEKSPLPYSHRHLAFLPIIVFIGNGICDSGSQFANKHYLMKQGIEEFVLFLFASAGFTGLVIFTIQLLTGRSRLLLKCIIGGIALGVPNYLSYVFFLKALATLSWGSSVIFPISNLGTVAVATVVSVFAFKEKISKINLLGLALAAVAILLIVLSNYFL